MESLQPIVNWIIGALSLIGFAAGVILPIVAFWSVSRAKGPRWEHLLLTLILLIGLPGLIGDYSAWLLREINNSFEASRPEMQQLFQNAQSVFHEDWLMSTPEATPTFAITVTDLATETATAYPVSTPTPTGTPQSIPLANPASTPTVFVCQQLNDITLGCLPPTPLVTPQVGN